MAALSDLFGQDQGVRMIIGKVSVITGDTFTMSYLGGLVDHIASLDQYTPVVNDLAVVLVWPKGGMIAVGSNNGTGAESPSVPYPSITGTVVAEGGSTYVVENNGGYWLPGVFEQAPDRAGFWFYDVDLFNPYRGAKLASFEVEIVRTSGGPVELQLHNNPGPDGLLDRPDSGPFIAELVPNTGVATWVNAPVGWGESLVNGDARGVGIGLGQHTGTYSGTGRLRFTTI